MPRSRHLPHGPEDALQRVRDDAARAVPVLAASPVLEMTFPVADVAVGIPHQLARVPNGYWIFLATGTVRATAVSTWTETQAFLSASPAGTVARLAFVITEDPRDA